MRKFFWIAWLTITALQCISFTQAYKLTDADHTFLLPVKHKIEKIAEDENKEILISLASRLEENTQIFDEDSRGAIVLRYLKAYVLRQFDIAVSGTGHLEQYRSEASDLASHTDGEIDWEVEDVTTSEPEVPMPTPDKMFNEEEFYNQYRQFVTSDDEELPENCVNYYDQIDEIAQQRDFPTALIIAMRYREHTCNFNNPANGRGNFQITSQYYPPGEITRDEFVDQVNNFIDFSEAKRAWYDNLLLRDDRAIDLTHDEFNLQDIRKHAILYNGIKQGTTPGTNDYANHNFWKLPDGRDGIVAAFLKVVKRHLEDQ